jgi:hypothetical protein
LFIAHGLYAFQVVPKFSSMRGFRLKPFQIIAWIVCALHTKIDSSFFSAWIHFADLAIGPSLVRPASITLHRFL